MNKVSNSETLGDLPASKGRDDVTSVGPIDAVGKNGLTELERRADIEAEEARMNPKALDAPVEAPEGGL